MCPVPYSDAVVHVCTITISICSAHMVCKGANVMPAIVSRLLVVVVLNDAMTVLLCVLTPVVFLHTINVGAFLGCGMATVPDVPHTEPAP